MKGGATMNVTDVMQRIGEIFKPYFQQMEKEEFVFAENGRERLRFEMYRTKGDTPFPLKKAGFMILDYGLVWNKDNKTALDEDELVAGSFITNDNLPLPILALEASMHLNKYDHLNIDLFPVSKDQRYRDIFCTPVQAIRKKYENLPGVPPGAITPNLPQGFTSGGMMSGDFDISFRAKTLPWWFEYVELYKSFLDTRDSYPILKDPAIIKEGRETRELFLSNFRKATPKILADIPNLNNEERGKKLGEILF
jgi:hypothetical protein